MRWWSPPGLTKIICLLGIFCKECDNWPSEMTSKQYVNWHLGIEKQNKYLLITCLSKTAENWSNPFESQLNYCPLLKVRRLVITVSDVDYEGWGCNLLQFSLNRSTLTWPLYVDLYHLGQSVESALKVVIKCDIWGSE